MKLLFGFRDETIVVLNSKRARSFDDGLHRGRCHKIQKSFTTKGVDDYIAEGSEYRRTNMDYFLYDVANGFLDRTINALGRELVKKEVIRHRQLQKLAEDSCLANATFPCEEDKAPPNPKSLHTCYFGDVGCGHECVMETVWKAMAT